MNRTRGESAARERPGIERWFRVVLFVSLALNLLVAGLFVGVAIMHGRDGRPPAFRMDQVGGPITAALSPRDRRWIGRELHRRFGQSRLPREDLVDKYQGIIDSLRAQPYDGMALRRAVQERLSAIQERARLGQKLLFERIDGMSDSERADLAARLERILGSRLP